MTKHGPYAPHGVRVTTCRHLQCDRPHWSRGLCRAHYGAYWAGASIAWPIGETPGAERPTGPKVDRMPERIAEIDQILADGGDLAEWGRDQTVHLRSIGEAARRLGRFDIERLCARLDRRITKGHI